MSNKDELKGCPVCLGTELNEILKVETLPAHCNLLWQERKQAIAAPRGDLDLVFCPSCGHVFNRAFDQALMEYTELYESTLDFSPTFQSYAQSLAEYLIARYDLHHKDVIDIGCGKGEFLKLLVDLGNNRGVGFDPSYEPSNGDDDYANQLIFIKEFYSQEHATYPADLIYSRHVLEHIAGPREFISMIRAAIGEDLHTALYFEVPNALYTFRDLGIWDLIYEHPSYFSPSSLTNLFVTSGFENIRVVPRYDGQFLGLEANPGKNTTHTLTFDAERTEIGTCVVDFQQRYQNKIECWRNRLRDLSSKGQRVVVWGAGSKGVTFLNLLREEADIDFIVDINPKKQGMFVPGTGSAIIPPEELKTFRPDHIILMNPIYAREIRGMVEGFGLSPEFWNA